MAKKKTVTLARNNSEFEIDKIDSFCLKCKHPESCFWSKTSCKAIPDFKIDTNGRLEGLLCDFLNWLAFCNIPLPQGDELITVNGYRILPKEIWDAITICSQEGVPNLVERYRKRLEILRTEIVKSL